MSSVLGRLGAWFARKPGARGSNRRSSTKRLRTEPLEVRRLLTASHTYFNDQWALVSDQGAPGLDVGDIVDNSIAWGGNVQATYGVDAFGIVSIGGVDSSIPGYSTLADAIDGASSGGVTTVFSSTSLAGSVEIDKAMVLEGEFSLASGDLTLDDADALLRIQSVPTASNTITLSSGDLNLTAGTVWFGINQDASHDEIVVNGAVNLAGAKLTVYSGDYDAVTGTQYVLIDNDGTDPVVGTFASLPENATFPVGEREVRISYQGGDGNDVVLTVTNTKYSFSSFVNDDWYSLGGGQVDNRNDVYPPTISRFFENPQFDADGIYSAGYDSIQDAIDATAERGSVTVLPGSYGPQNVSIDKKVTLVGAFDLDGSLTVNDVAVKLLTGTDFGEISTTGLELSATTTLTLKASDDGADLITVDGPVDLGDARLELSWTGQEPGNLVILDNQSMSPITGTFHDLPEGAPLIFNGNRFWITYQGGDGNDVELIAPSASIAGRHIFYNNSKFDGNTTGVSTNDDSAIATDKTALLPGGVVSFANATSYSRGINGIMVDIDGSHPDIGVDDFYFQVGDSADANAPASWSSAPAPTIVSVRAGAGVGGSDRIEIIWADGDITDKWLRVNVLPTINTGLSRADVFFFANKVGETGNISGTTFATSVSDEIGARDNPGFNVAVTNVYDFNRDGNVSLSDQLVARNATGLLAFMDSTVGPAFQSITGPRKWIPGQEVTLTASLPTNPDGTIDETLTDVDFYQDVNGNGFYDPDDVFLATGVAGSGNGTWSGTFDPADLVPGSTGVLAIVPDRPFVFPPAIPQFGNFDSVFVGDLYPNPGPVVPNTTFVFDGVGVGLITAVNADTPLQTLYGVSINTGTSAAVYASGGVSGPGGAFVGYSSATAQVSDGNNPQVVLTANATGGINLVMPGGGSLTSTASATVAPLYRIESNLPIGTPVTVTITVQAATGGTGVIPGPWPGGGDDTLGWGESNAVMLVMTETRTFRVGDTAAIFGGPSVGALASPYWFGPGTISSFGFAILVGTASVDG